MDIHIMVNWQLSKKAICWPVSHDCIAGSWTLFTTPPPPHPSKEKLHNHCFQFLLGITVIPSKIEDNGYVKFWGGGDKQGALWSMWQWWIEWMNGDVFCKVIHGPVIGFQLIVGSVPKFPIVKETVSFGFDGIARFILLQWTQPWMTSYARMLKILPVFLIVFILRIVVKAYNK